MVDMQESLTLTGGQLAGRVVQELTAANLATKVFGPVNGKTAADLVLGAGALFYAAQNNTPGNDTVKFAAAVAGSKLIADEVVNMAKANFGLFSGSPVVTFAAAAPESVTVPSRLRLGGGANSLVRVDV